MSVTNVDVAVETYGSNAQQRAEAASEANTGHDLTENHLVWEPLAPVQNTWNTVEDYPLQSWNMFLYKVETM